MKYTNVRCFVGFWIFFCYFVKYFIFSLKLFGVHGNKSHIDKWCIWYVHSVGHGAWWMVCMGAQLNTTLLLFHFILFTVKSHSTEEKTSPICYDYSFLIKTNTTRFFFFFSFSIFACLLFKEFFEFCGVLFFFLRLFQLLEFEFDLEL